MTASHPARLLALVLIGIMAAGCAANGQYLDRRNGVGGHATTAELQDVPVHGAEVLVELNNGEERDGELLAADANGISVLESTNDITYIPRNWIDSVQVILYESASGATGWWFGLGAASTLSHGFLLILSLPVWIGTGVTAEVGSRRASKLDVQPAWLDALYQFARFPQGLPPGFIARWNALRQHKATWISTEPGQSAP